MRPEVKTLKKLSELFPEMHNRILEEEEDIDALLDGKKTTMTTQNLAKHTSKIKDSVKNGWDDDSWSNLYEDEGKVEEFFIPYFFNVNHSFTGHSFFSSYRIAN